MAAPVLVNVGPIPPPLAWEESATLDAVAYDPDLRHTEAVFLMTAGSGGQFAQLVTAASGSGGLTLEITPPPGSTATVDIDPLDPMRFTVTNGRPAEEIS